MHVKKEPIWNGVRMVHYAHERKSASDIHPWLSDFESKLIRAEACFKKALEMKDEGFTPDLIIAHHGWGESLFLKDVWPHAKLGLYCEFYYNPIGADVGFDPEFPATESTEVCRLKMRNINNLMHFQIADAGISPTSWQANSFPADFKNKISVIHDGIDTATVMPNDQVSMSLKTSKGKELTLQKDDEIVTFVNRNLEPYRGYHTFMRSLPSLLRQRPKARVILVGGHDVSYGPKPDSKIYKKLNWKDVFIDEVRSQISDEDWQRVHFVGHMPYQVFVSLLQLSTVHVYLTYPFVLSWSLLEAMSSGCAIVASNTAPVLEAIEHNQTGRLFNFFEPSELVDQVCDLLNHPDERLRLGTNARKFAQLHYDLQTVCLPKQLQWVESLVC